MYGKGRIAHQERHGRGSAIAEAISRLRRPLLDLLAAGPGLYYFISPELDRTAVAWLLPLIQQPGMQIRVLTSLAPEHLAAQPSALDAVVALRGLPECELRGRDDLAARVYLRAGGDALVTSATLTGPALDANLEYGLRLRADAAATVQADAEGWWHEAQPLAAAAWEHLAGEVAGRRDLRRLTDELSRLGVFIRVSVRGTRRTRRLDPRDYGLAGDTLRVGPVDLHIWAVPEVTRAREELERELLQVGAEWAGHVLVPRAYAEQEWPRLFAARQQELERWATSAGGLAAIGDSVRRARAAAERWFALLYDELAAVGQAPPEPAAAYIAGQVDRLVGDADATTILENVGLEYRALQIVPEDDRSLAEVQDLLQHPRFRTLQQRWPL